MSFLVRRLNVLGSVRRYTWGYLSLYLFLFAFFSLYQLNFHLAGEPPEVAPQLGRGLKEYERFTGGGGSSALQGVSNQTDSIRQQQLEPKEPDLVEKDLPEKQTLDDFYLFQDSTTEGVTFSILSEEEEQKVISSDLYFGIANQEQDIADMSEDNRSDLEDLSREVVQIQLPYDNDLSDRESEPREQQQEEQPFPFQIQPPLPPGEVENPPRMTVEQDNPEQEAQFDTVEEIASQSELDKSPQQGQSLVEQSQSLVNGPELRLEYKAPDLHDLSGLNLQDIPADRPEGQYGNLNIESIVQGAAVQPDISHVVANQQSINLEGPLQALGKPMSGIPYNVKQDGSANNVPTPQAIPGLRQPPVVDNLQQYLAMQKQDISAAENIQRQLTPSFQSQNVPQPILAPGAPAPIQWNVPQQQAYQPQVPPKEMVPIKQGHGYIYSQGPVPMVSQAPVQQYIPAPGVPGQSPQMRPVDQLVINPPSAPSPVAIQQAPAPRPVPPNQGLPPQPQQILGSPVIQSPAESERKEMDPGTLDSNDNDYAYDYSDFAQYYLEDGAGDDYADHDAGHPLETDNTSDYFDSPNPPVENSPVVEESNKISGPQLSGTKRRQVASDEEEDDIDLESTPHSGARVKPLPVVPRRVVYNRVGKCGSTTVKSLIKGLSLRNGFSFVSSKVYRVRRIPSTQEQVCINLHINTIEFAMYWCFGRNF